MQCIIQLRIGDGDEWETVTHSDSPAGMVVDYMDNVRNMLSGGLSRTEAVKLVRMAIQLDSHGCIAVIDNIDFGADQDDELHRRFIQRIL